MYQEKIHFSACSKIHFSACSKIHFSACSQIHFSACSNGKTQGERGEKRIDESKNVQTTPTRTYYKRSRPLPYCNPNCRTPRHWKFTQDHRTTRPPRVGETNSAIYGWMNGHRSDWTRSLIAEDFQLQNHDFNSHISLCCTDYNAQWSDDTRKAHESYWIRQLNTTKPHSISKSD